MNRLPLALLAVLLLSLSACCGSDYVVGADEVVAEASGPPLAEAPTEPRAAVASL